MSNLMTMRKIMESLRSDGGSFFSRQVKRNMADRLEDQKDEIDSLYRSLYRYGKHEDGCTLYHGMGTGDGCTCGLEKALKRPVE